VAVGGNNSAVGGVVGPIAPVFAGGIFAIFGVVLIDETIGAAPDRLHDAGPGIANADVARGAGASFYFLAGFIPDDWIDAESGGARAAGLHGVESGLGGDQEATGFGLPPGVDDDRFLFSDDVVVPAPDVRLDGFADRGHVLEVVVVFFRLFATGFAEHPDG